jgi:RimJ/RimL family protein N-acetyltransferase
MEKKIIFRGKLVTLRPLSLKDAPRFCRWLDDPEITNFLLRHGQPAPKLKEEQEWIKERAKKKDEFHLAIDANDGEHIGIVSLMKIDYYNKNAVYGIFIGNKKYWGQGCGTEAGRLMISYGFRNLKLHHIVLSYIAYNIRGFKSYKKIGFKPEGRLRQQIFRNNYWHDDMMMGILREEWQKRISNKK